MNEPSSSRNPHRRAARAAVTSSARTVATDAVRDGARPQRAPTFSIVMPSHDNGPYLREAVESALRQTRPPHEVLVVDDGSRDGSVELLRGYGERVRVVEVEPCTIGAARNAALPLVTGEYVVLLDADDVLLPWALEVWAREIVRHGRPVLAMSRWRQFATADELPVEPGETRARAWPDLLAAMGEPLPITTATAIRADALRRAGGFLSARFGSEDIDLWLRIGLDGGFVYLDGAPLYGYRQHAGSTTHTVARLIPGIDHLVRRERAGAYPGGRARARQRRRLIARNVLFAVGRCWQLGAYGAGYRLWLRSLPYTVGAGLGGEARRIALRPLRARVHRWRQRGGVRTLTPRPRH